MDRDEVALILGIAPDRRPDHPDRLRRRVRRQARPRRPRPDRPRGVADRPAGPRRLDAPGIDGRQPEAPSRPASGRRPAPTPRAASPATASTATSTPAPTPRGARRSPTACRSTRWARTRYDAVLATTRADLHEQPARRRVPGLRRAAGRDRPRGAMDDARRSPGQGPRSSSGSPTRSAPGPRPRAASGSTRAPGCRPASRRSGRTGSGSAPRRRPTTRTPPAAPTRTRRGRRHRRHVVRHRQHRARQSLDDRDGRHRATAGVVLFCGAVDIGQGASTVLVQIAADALGVPAPRRRAGQRRHRPNGGRRQVVGVPPDVRLRQRGAPRGRGPPTPDPAARRRSATTRPLALRGRAGSASPDASGRTAAIELAELPPVAVHRRVDGMRPRGPRHVRSGDDAARRGRPGRAVPDVRVRGADRGGRGRSRARAPSRSGGSSRRTTSAGRSTRRRSRARSTAGSRRASASR